MTRAASIVKASKSTAGAVVAGACELDAWMLVNRARASVIRLVHYPVPIHRQRAFVDVRLREGALPIAERLARQVLSLPLRPSNSATQQSHVARTLRAATTA